MNRSAKQITFLYFSVVAFAISAIHISVFESTTDDLENLYAQNRLDRIYENLNEMLEDKTLEVAPKVVPIGSILNGEPAPIIYFDRELFQSEINISIDLNYDETYEMNDLIEQGDPHNYFIVRKRTPFNQDLWIVIENTVYELSEEQLVSKQAKQFLISFTLLLLSLYVVLKISERLTNPITEFAATLSRRSPDDLSAVQVPSGSASRELVQLVNNFNDFQDRMKALMDKQTAFNRYASHELRSPLTVISGALTLLDASDDKAFVLKQKHRMKKATHEMQEFIETLLDLSKDELNSALHPRKLDRTSIENVIKSHEHLIENKNVSWEIDIVAQPTVSMPDPVFHILLGNLVKNAFAYTSSGKVKVKLLADELIVIDSGVGLQGEKTLQQGYGLGLLMVRDICQRYHLTFSLSDHPEGGCIASIILSEGIPNRSPAAWL